MIYIKFFYSDLLIKYSLNYLHYVFFIIAVIFLYKLNKTSKLINKSQNIKESKRENMFLDINAEKCVRDAIYKQEGIIYVSDVENIKNLKFDKYKDVESIEGIEYLKRLERSEEQRLNSSHL